MQLVQAFFSFLIGGMLTCADFLSASLIQLHATREKTSSATVLGFGLKMEIACCGFGAVDEKSI